MVFTPVSGAVATAAGAVAGVPGFVVGAAAVNAATSVSVDPDEISDMINQLSAATDEIRANLVRNIDVEPSKFGAAYPSLRAGFGHQRAHHRMVEVLEGVVRDLETFSENLAMVVSDIDEVEVESSQTFAGLEQNLFVPSHTDEALSRPVPSTPDPVEADPADAAAEDGGA